MVVTTPCVRTLFKYACNFAKSRSCALLSDVEYEDGEKTKVENLLGHDSTHESALVRSFTRPLSICSA